MPLFSSYHRLPLRAKLSLWVSAGVSAIVVVLMLAMCVGLQETTLRSVTQVQAALVEGAAHDVEDKLRVRGDALRVAADTLGHRLPIIQGTAVDEHFQTRPLTRYLFDNILVGDLGGRVVYESSSPPGSIRPPMTDRTFFKEVVRTGALVISPPVLGKVSRAPVLAFSVPVRDIAGRMTGVMVGLLRLDRPNFLSELGTLHIGDAGYLVLMTQGATPAIISHPKRDRILQTLPQGGASADTALRPGTTVTREGVDAEGTPSLLTRRALAGAPWVLEAVYPTAEAFAGLRRQQRQVLGIGAGVAVLSWVMVWWLTTRLLAPVDKLRRAMQLDATGSENMLRAIRADSTDMAELIEAYYAQKARRQATEAELAASERRLRDIADNLPAVIAYVDRDRTYRFVNAHYRTLFGIDPAELIGKTITEGMGERNYERVREPMDAVLAGRPQTFERVVDDSATCEHLLVSYLPDFDATGAVAGFYAMSLDITERKRHEVELRANQRLLDRTGSVAGVGGWELELASGQLSWTQQTRRIHEVDDNYVPSVSTAIDFYAPAGRQAIEQALTEAMEHGTPWDLELPFTTATGRSIWVRATGEVERDAGRPVRMFGAFQDVTQRVSDERQLREQAELLHVTLKSIGDGVITADEFGCVRWMNPAAERMTGWTSEAAVGRPTGLVFHIVNADTRAPAPDPVSICLSTLGQAGLPERTVLLSVNGQEFAIEDSASPIHDARGELRGAVLVFHDVSEQRRMSDQMTHRATHDALTGLVNRSEFETRLARVLVKAADSHVDNAMMFIDLDQFKLVNDACGHAMGDKLLCQVSDLLRASVRNRDTLARLGGDEFGVILEHCTVEQAQRVAEGICARMDEFRFVHDGRRFRIGTSIGLVPVDSRWANSAALQKAADTACYAAKEAGRNRVHVWYDTDSAMRARDGETQWGSRIEDALDDNDFVLFAQALQPLHPGREGDGLHFEVLIRLTEADGTLVAPGRFLPAAERFHMASRIDRWVVRTLFEWLRGQGGSPPDIETIAINLSGQSIGDRAFHRDVVQLLSESGIDPKKLCFEVTETSAITNLGDASAFIREVRGLGVRVALDDFGAGASSFGYLKNLPVDYLKIDGQFIRNIERDPLDMAAVRCFHEVARAIGVQTIAEFVETESIREVLRGIGIDYAQGYLIHRPEPLDDLLRRVRSERAGRVAPVAAA